MAIEIPSSPVGNNVVPLRSNTIQLVQNGCSFYGLRSEDPNQHLMDFLKLVDSLNLDGENKERTRLRLQLHNDIMMFQQHEGESLSEAWTQEPLAGVSFMTEMLNESWALSRGHGGSATKGDKEVTMQYLELKGGDKGACKLLGDVIEVLGCLLEVLGCLK
ncbi:hypothetical protein Tco_0097142 [Tanacetum coccineum]